MGRGQRVDAGARVGGISKKKKTSATIKRAMYDHLNRRLRAIIAATPVIQKSRKYHVPILPNDQKSQLGSSCGRSKKKFPTSKTVNRLLLNESLRYIFQNFQQIRAYYTIGQRKLNFKLYGKKRKALTEMCKRLVAGSIKYSNEVPPVQQLNPLKWKPMTPTDQLEEKQRPVIIPFDADRFGNLCGNISAPTVAFKQVLSSIILPRFADKIYIVLDIC